MKHRLVFSILISFILSLLMLCWITWINLGWSPQFFANWMNAFKLAWPAAAVISFIFGPFIHAATGGIVKRSS